LVASFLSLLTIYFLVKALYISTPNVPLFEKDMINFNTSWATLPVAILFILTLLGLLFGTSVKSLYILIQTKIESQIINVFEK
jgi:asparagine N-glycosylation enzyme membrane subunit Stt3